MFKKLLPLLASLMLAATTSCNKETIVEPSASSVSRLASANAEDITDTPRKVGATKAGDVYARQGSEKELAQALEVLKAHPETPYDEFDLSSLTVVEVAKQVNGYSFHSLKSATRVLSIAGWGTEQAQPIIVDVTTDKETSYSTVHYFNYVSDAVTAVTEGPKGLSYNTTAIAGRYKPCGDAVMGCINDAYSNHGWISVWATVQSAFLPETVAAIAVACALHNC